VFGYSQIKITSGEVSTISNAGEGDHYLTTDTNEMYIGIQTGEIRKISNPNEVTTLKDNADGTITYTDELGNPVTINLSNSQGWSLTGNSITDPAANFLGTTDAQDLVFRTNSIESFRIRQDNNYIGIGTLEPASPLHINKDLADGVGIIRVEGTEPDINFNDTDGGFNTFTFENDGTPKFAFGRRNTDDFYITRNDGAWHDDTFNILNTNGFVGLNIAVPTERLDVNGNLRVSGSYKDSNNEAGTLGQILSSTVTGTDWIDASSASETVTIYTDATVGTKHKIGEYTNETPITVAINETVTNISTPITGHKIADYTNEVGGTPVDINETVTTITDTNTDTATTKKEIATYVNENGGIAVAIQESVTTFNQNQDPTTPTGVITYTDEAGGTSIANVVSTDTTNPDNGASNPNSISVGSDGGAYFASPLTRAIHRPTSAPFTITNALAENYTTIILAVDTQALPFLPDTTTRLINLPTASSCTGKIYIIKNTINTKFDNGITDYLDNRGNTENELDREKIYWFQSDGSNWQLINNIKK